MTDTETLTFENNALMPDLCGPTHSHLSLIESLTGLTINSRGNEITLSGPLSARAQTREILNHLYAQLENGQPVDQSVVQDAFRLAESVTPSASAGNLGPILNFGKRTVAPRSATQAAYLSAMEDNELVFGIGPAGTGKTYLAVAHAALQLKTETVRKIILCRPAVEAGERIGFLPGDAKEKIDPYMRPLYDALHDVLGHDYVEKRLEREIEIAPLAFMRGRTLSDAVIVLDEAQNATIAQMKMFLTRLGEGSQMIITGDPSQTDLPDIRQSGLSDALSLLNRIKGVSVARFTGADVVRHRLVLDIVNAYDARDRARSQGRGQQNAS